MEKHPLSSVDLCILIACSEYPSFLFSSPYSLMIFCFKNNEEIKKIERLRGLCWCLMSIGLCFHGWLINTKNALDVSSELALDMCHNGEHECPFEYSTKSNLWSSVTTRPEWSTWCSWSLVPQDPNGFLAVEWDQVCFRGTDKLTFFWSWVLLG